MTSKTFPAGRVRAASSGGMALEELAIQAGQARWESVETIETVRPDSRSEKRLLDPEEVPRVLRSRNRSIASSAESWLRFSGSRSQAGPAVCGQEPFYVVTVAGIVRRDLLRPGR